MPLSTPDHDGDLLRRAFADDLRESLTHTPRRIASRYLYDDLGSQLFEAICRLPWYRVTRAELRLLRQHGGAMLEGTPPPAHLVELGCGSGDKLAALVEAARVAIGEIQLVDVSPAALEMTSQRLSRLGLSAAHVHQASYEDGLCRAADVRPDSGALVVLFLGSNIGNFERPVRQSLMRMIRAALRPGDALLLGTDLVKPEAELLLAYDDPLQVTSAFNRNLLRRINDELGGTFDLAGFVHEARWNAAAGRMEMHLVSLRQQRVRIALADLDLEFQPGEAIWTESSYKFDPDEVRSSGLDAGFSHSRQWVDEAARFALTRFEVGA